MDSLVGRGVTGRGASTRVLVDDGASDEGIEGSVPLARPRSLLGDAPRVALSGTGAPTAVVR